MPLGNERHSSASYHPYADLLHSLALANYTAWLRRSADLRLSPAQRAYAALEAVRYLDELERLL